MSGTATKKTPRKTPRKKNVSIIPSQKEYSKEVHPEQKILRVAAYCRVSTLQEQQESSFEAQKSYYMEMISANPNWKMAGIYADGPVKIGLNQKHPTARGALV